MLRHVVLLQLDPAAADSVRDAMLTALRDLPAQINGIVNLVATVDAGLADGNADVLLQLDFADADAWRAYSTHPAHKAVIADHIAPILRGKTALQVDLP